MRVYKRSQFEPINCSAIFRALFPSPFNNYHADLSRGSDAASIFCTDSDMEVTLLFMFAFACDIEYELEFNTYPKL